MSKEWSKSQWLSFQKQMIREEYKDLTPARRTSEKQFTHTVRTSLSKVQKHVRA